MRNFRSLIDITPWDKNGYSFWGLNREQAKVLGLVFIILGLLFADPPFSFIPSDFINLWAAGLMTKYLSLSLELSLLLTYTIIAWGLIFIGITIYPYDSERLFNGIMNKIKRGIKQALENPILLGVCLVVFYFIFQWYKNALNTPMDASDSLWKSFILYPTPATTLVVLGVIVLIAIAIARRQTK